MIRKVYLGILMMLPQIVWATDGVPTAAGAQCTFSENVRYSELVINSRINDFKANNNAAGFGRFNSNGQMVEQPNGWAFALDYVPGLVAKAIGEAVDYYKDSEEVDVAPWFYAIQYYGCSYNISDNGKNGRSFDDLNAVKLYFKLAQLASAGRFPDGQRFSNATTLSKARERFADALSGIARADENCVIKESTLPEAAGGWWHKYNYTDQMWCDGQYMGPALLAQLINEAPNYEALTADDWALITRQFDITWQFLWNPETKLLYHAFTADPGGMAAAAWAGVSAQPGAEVYHSAEYWGRAVAWYFMALVDVLEQMQAAGLTDTDSYMRLHGYLQQLAEGVAAKQDEASGCWYQLLNHDGSFVATHYDSSYSYTNSPVANYLEASCTAIFTAAYLKGMRLQLFDADYTALATKAYQGFVNQFMVSDGNGGVHLVYSCKSAGLGGGNNRDGSAEYYLLGRDTKPTTNSGSDFYTEGKVLGGFIMAATEYERMQDDIATSAGSPALPDSRLSTLDSRQYTISGQRVAKEPQKGVYIMNGKKVVRKK
jgi:rhamnogalacturonyl hydrolase YesR